MEPMRNLWSSKEPGQADWLPIGKGGAHDPSFSLHVGYALGEPGLEGGESSFKSGGKNTSKLHTADDAILAAEKAQDLQAFALRVTAS